MKFLRNILSHGLLIIFFAALAMAYVYRVQLFPENINTKIDYYVDSSLIWAGVSPKEKQPVQITANNVEGGEPVTTKQQDVSASEKTSTEIEEPAALEGEDETLETQVEQDEASSVEVQVMPVPENNTDKMVELKKNKLIIEKNDNIESADTDQPSADAVQSELFDRARIAFQNGKPEQSTQLYKELSELNPDNPDIYGEMGNVLYSQGKWKQAGVAFYEAAICLLEQGKRQQVPYLYRVIQGLDPESAEKLRSKLH